MVRTAGNAVLLQVLAGFLLFGFPKEAKAQGALVVTGRYADAPHWGTSAYPGAPLARKLTTACLDYLVFGKQASPAQIAARPGIRIAFIHQSDPVGTPPAVRLQGGYRDPSPFFLKEAGWQRALDSGAFDVVMLGTAFLGPDSSERKAALLAARPTFQAFVNRGGKVFVFAQFEYVFLPKLEAARIDLARLDSTWITQSGLDIGMSRGDTTMDYLSYTLRNVDTTVFKVFEGGREGETRTRNPVTIGFHGLWKDTVLIPKQDTTVQRPLASVPSGPFPDSLCVDFSTPSPGAHLVYTLDGSPPATSSLRLDSPGRLCFRRTVTVRMLGRKLGWLDSPETTFTYVLKPPLPLPQAAKPIATLPSGTPFADSLCVTFSTATPDAILQMTLDGRIPDSTSPRLPPSGTWCFHGTATVSLIASKPGWKPSDTAVFTYVLNPPRPPSTLELYAEGRRIDVVSSDHSSLEVRLARAAGAACGGCTARVFPTGSADRETVPLAGGGGNFQGTFLRMESAAPVPGDGTLQHLAADSLVVAWVNPEDSLEAVRRVYPYRGPGDILAIRPHNAIARADRDPALPGGPAWIVSDAAGLDLGKGGRACCSIASVPVDAHNPDSLRLVGFIIEASRGFTLDLKVYSHLGEPVHQVAFAVSDAEFPKLAAGARKGTRLLRLLWSGTTREGTRAGNGVYVFKSVIALSPAPGSGLASAPVKSALRIGILR